MRKAARRRRSAWGEGEWCKNGAPTMNTMQMTQNLSKGLIMQLKVGVGAISLSSEVGEADRVGEPFRRRECRRREND